MSFSPSFRVGLRRHFASLLAALLLCTIGAAAEKKRFEVPAGPAEKSLREFAAQSGLQVIFPSETALNAQTQAIRGELSAREALDRMLAGTNLVAEQDPRTGVVSIRRRNDTPADPKQPPASPPAPTNNAARNAAGETVTLSVFEVSSERDYGYRATNSITATGIGTEIYRTPINVSVITRDLIQDMAAVSLRESLQYTANVYSDRRDPNVVVSRGFDAPVLVNRNAGTVRNPAPDFIERVEIVKGPNSVFFGRVSPSGVVNLITLQPKSRQETEVRATFGSFEHAQGFISHNQPLGRNAAVRVAGSTINRNSGYVDSTYLRQNAGYAALTWSPLPALKLNVVGQIVDGKENVMHSVPNGHPGYREFTRQNPQSTLLLQEWGAQFLPGQPFRTVYLDPHESFSNGWQGNNNGPDAFKLDQNWFVQAEALYTPAKWLTLRAAGRTLEDRRETLEIAGFPTFDGTFPRQRPSYNGTRTLSQIAELEAVLVFDTGPASHRLLLGGRQGRARNGGWAIGNNLTIPVTWNNRTQGPRQLIRDHFVGGQLPAEPHFAMPRTEDTGFYAIDQIGFLDERVKLLVGARTTEVTNVGATAATRGPDRTQKEDTPQFGLLVEPFPGLALFFNASETFEPQFNVDVRGNLANNVLGEGREAGFKFDLADRLLSGTVTWFEIERSGESRRDFATENATGIAPLFVPGGTKRSEGMDLEVFITPARNWQAIASYTYLWEAKAISDLGAPQIVGRRLGRAPKHLLALWNKYTFTAGPLKRVSAGLGFRYTSEINTLLDPNFDLKNPSFTTTDVVIGYSLDLWERPVTVQLNVKNLFDREYLDGNFTPADPRSFFVTLGARF